jgi:hypothetical protein
MASTHLRAHVCGQAQSKGEPFEALFSETNSQFRRRPISFATLQLEATLFTMVCSPSPSSSPRSKRSRLCYTNTASKSPSLNCPTVYKRTKALEKSSKPSTWLAYTSLLSSAPPQQKATKPGASSLLPSTTLNPSFLPPSPSASRKPVGPLTNPSSSPTRT